jgi:hypothetical protein
LGTKSSLGLDQRKLATLYTVMMYVVSCTVQCTVQCTATSQAAFTKSECCRSATISSSHPLCYTWVRSDRK